MNDGGRRWDVPGAGPLFNFQERNPTLVLSRQKDEAIKIGDDVEVTVVDIRGDKVRLGVTAPKSISVHRLEVYEAVQRENREAAGMASA